MDIWRCQDLKFIAYKLFTPSFGFSRELLLQTETAILSEDSRRLVTRTSKGILTFDIVREEPPEPPSTFKMVLAREGVLRPPFIADAYDDDILLGFVAALQQACCCQILRTIPQSLSFPPSSVLNGDRLVHCQPTVQASGELNLRLYEERTALKPFRIGDDYGIVWLFPGGRPARVVGSSPPMPGLAQVWWMFMKATTFYQGNLDEIEVSRWVHVAYDGRNLLWPLALTKTAMRPQFEWKPSPPLREAVDKILVGVKRPAEEDLATKPPIRSWQHLVAPPPSPLPNSSHIVAASVGAPAVPAPPRQPLTPVGLPPQYPTPAYHSSPDHDYDESDSLDVVTNNDFDFYDQPLNDQTISDQPHANTSKPSPPPVSPPAAPAVDPESGSDGGLYAALPYDNQMRNIDSKYLEGGRYHISSPVDMELDAMDESNSCSDTSESQNERDERIQGDAFVGKPQAEEIKVFCEEWMSVLWPSTQSPQGTPATSYTQELMAQIVWDGGILGPVANGIMFDEPAVRASDSIVSAVATVLPGLKASNIESDETTEARLLSPPLYLFRRDDNPVKARASILQFWRTFSLQPFDGARDITCVVLTLERDGEAQNFASQLKSSYEACGLGRLELPTCKGSELRGGVFEIVADILHSRSSGIVDSFEVGCSILRRLLADNLDSGSNLLLLMAIPPRGLDRMPLQPLSRGFQTLMSTFMNARWFLTTNEVFEMPSQLSLDRLSMLIYDRWDARLNLNSDNSKEQSTSVFHLAHLAPKMISLKYTPTPPAQVVKEAPVIHIAYAFSFDKRWVAVAWTDPWATNTKIEAFRVGLPHSGAGSRTRANSPTFNYSGKSSFFETTAGDIARITSKIFMEQASSIIITKCGSMDPRELLEWKKVFSNVSVLQLPHPRGLLLESIEKKRKHLEQPHSDSVVVRVDEEMHGEVHDNYAILSRGELQLEIDWVFGNKKDLGPSMAQFRRLASWSVATGITSSPILPWHAAAVNKMSAALIAL